MTEYGITKERDSDGNRKPVDHTFEFDGDEITIQLMPPTISEVEEFEEFGDDMPASKLKEIFNRHILKPDVEDPTITELTAYVQGLVDYANGGTELADAAKEELEARGAEGN